MKIALIGDVHANLSALETVLKHCNQQKVKQIINIGDFVGYGGDPNETVNILKNLKDAVHIIGNYDIKVLNFLKLKNKLEKKLPAEKFLSFKFASEQLSDENKSFLAGLPSEYRAEINGFKILAVHGSPDSVEEHLSKETPKKRFAEIAEKTDADIIVSGHTHKFFTKKTGRTLFINTGSVGRQDDGKQEAGYVILDIMRNKFVIKNYRIKYDVSKAVDSIKKNNLPEIFGQMIIKGRAFDYLIAENLLNSDYLQKIKEFAAAFNYEEQHSLQVRNLALKLFDGLKTMHQLGDIERLYLECAAVLHDIGFFRGAKKHHKHSFNMILSAEDLPFTEKQKLLIALIARYHRKNIPNEKKHKEFAALSKNDKNMIRKTAALLRIADGLDVTHNEAVTDITCKINDDNIIINCKSVADLTLEKLQALKKADLFLITFQKKIDIQILN